jgi:hypothetical protein
MILKTRKQVGGDHYSKLAIQPREFAMRNRWDSDSFSILKYLTRYPDKAGVEDVRKARHFAEMRRDWPELIVAPQSPPHPISMQTYIVQNELPLMTANALTELDFWVYGGYLWTDHAERTIRQIDMIIDWLDSTS